MAIVRILCRFQMFHWPLAFWDCGFESRRTHGCLSPVSVTCCRGRGFCYWPIPRPGKSYRVRCVSVCVVKRNNNLLHLKLAGDANKKVISYTSDVEKLSLSKPWRNTGKVKVWLHSYVNSPLDSRTGCYFRVWYPLNRRMGGSQRRSRRFGEDKIPFLLLGFEPWMSQNLT